MARIIVAARGTLMLSGSGSRASVGAEEGGEAASGKRRFVVQQTHFAQHQSASLADAGHSGVGNSSQREVELHFWMFFLVAAVF